MSKREKIEFRTLRSNKAGNGNIFIATLFPNGAISFEMARQKGFIAGGDGRQLPKFDYENTKINFALSDIEAAQVVTAYHKQLLQGPHPREIKFPHMSAAVPKNILFKFVPNNVGEMQLQVMVSEANSDKNAMIYLNEAETEIIVANLKNQYLLANKLLVLEQKDDREFKLDSAFKNSEILRVVTGGQ